MTVAQGWRDFEHDALGLPAIETTMVAGGHIRRDRINHAVGTRSVP